MSERDDLKARAEELKLDFAPNLSTAKLAELVAEAEAQGASADEDKAPADDGSNSFEEALAVAAASSENAKQPGGTDAAQPTFHGRKFLRVVGPEKGFRRAGRKFGSKPVDIPLDELSEEQELALKGERRLITSYHVEGVSD
ncbi:hypothetical protein [Tritonibacter scottomollicae]|uniref:Mu-like prophage FluMu N-terminal domain-containing protein n=1 Tax=Tritonibacter scottomollicae TaxID=483013 RepID=A0A2T1AIA4_TRISK|nr:hypothetical protein [Tritonibacter scottomollicae]PRZ48345.1 hypothetical protein CLV89_104173 [Tritonibacter scottomollicae]